MREGNANAVGCDGKENDMNTTTAFRRQDLPPVCCPFSSSPSIGATVLFVAGHAQSATLHDAAHDMRHATGFPCH